jgi:hypothetical protein
MRMNAFLNSSFTSVLLFSSAASSAAEPAPRVESTEIPSCASLGKSQILSANPGFRCVTRRGVEFEKMPLDRDSAAFGQDAWQDLRTGTVWGERMGRTMQKTIELRRAVLPRNRIIVASEAVSLCENDDRPGKLPTLEVFMDALIHSGLEEVLPAIRFNPNSMEYFATSTPVRGTHHASTVWAIDITLSSSAVDHPDASYVTSYRAARTAREVSLNEVVCVRDRW